MKYSTSKKTLLAAAVSTVAFFSQPGFAGVSGTIVTQWNDAAL